VSYSSVRECVDVLTYVSSQWKYKRKKWCASVVFSSQNITRVKDVKSKHLSLAEFLVLWSMDRLSLSLARLCPQCSNARAGAGAAKPQIEAPVRTKGLWLLWSTGRSLPACLVRLLCRSYRGARAGARPNTALSGFRRGWTFDMLLLRGEVPKKDVPFSNGQPFKTGPWSQQNMEHKKTIQDTDISKD
jgi:hypothetical protein